jgi:hypothetical protein
MVLHRPVELAQVTGNLPYDSTRPLGITDIHKRIVDRAGFVGEEFADFRRSRCPWGVRVKTRTRRSKGMAKGERASFTFHKLPAQLPNRRSGVGNTPKEN